MDIRGFVEVLEILAEFIYGYLFLFLLSFRYFFSQGILKKHEKLVIDLKGWRAETVSE